MKKSLKLWSLGSARELLKTKVFRVIEQQVLNPVLNREEPYFLLSGIDWVNVVALDTMDPSDAATKVLWVKQYRPGPHAITWEIPGGACDRNDSSPLESAQRELLEETGATASKWIHLGSLSPNPALFQNQVHTYLALGCRVDASLKIGVDGEEIETEWTPLFERHQLARDGKINHALVLAAFDWLENYLRVSSKG